MSNKYDHYISNEGPSALVIREHLIPVEGRDGVVFPPTFAKGDNFPGGYNIDSSNDTNICLIDSVGSQANRIEPIFKEEKYQHLIPQVTIIAGAKRINLLEAGHRAGDAIVRCSSLEGQISDAFKAVLAGNAEPLAQIAPTSLVFGVWDSRETYAKIPRLLTSTIRAYNVRKVTRSAQYVPATEYVANGLLSETTDKNSDSYAERGFIHVPATGNPGGVIADGGIRRDATLALVALRLLFGPNEESTLKLRRYILGLALTAFTLPPTGYLRQGCLLVLDPENPRNFDEIFSDGKRVPATISHQDALAYATEAAAEFQVKQELTEGSFEVQRAQKDLEKAKKVKKAKNTD